MEQPRDKCIMCGSVGYVVDSTNSNFLALREPFRLVMCETCGFRWLNPCLASEDMSKLYGEGYYERGEDAKESYEDFTYERCKYFRNRIIEAADFLGKNRLVILDVGAGTGDFLMEAGRLGHKTYGIELSTYACLKAKDKYGINLMNEDFLRSDFEENFFDLVHMNHVLEHLTSPVAYLDKILKILKPEGLFIVEVPNQFENLLDMVKKMLRKNKPSFDLRSVHHPYFYNTKSLRRLLEERFCIKILRTWNPYARLYTQNPVKKALKALLFYIGGKIGRGFFIEVYAIPKKA